MERINGFFLGVLSVGFFLEAALFTSLPFGTLLYLAPLLAIVSLKKGWRSYSTLGLTILLLGIINQQLVAPSLIDLVFFIAFHLLLVASFDFISRNYKTSLAVLSFILLGVTLDYVNITWSLMDDRWILADAFWRTKWTQWYSYTGILGGSFWVLMINMGAFIVFFKDNPFEKYIWRWRSAFLLGLIVLIPGLLSANIFADNPAGPTEIGLYSSDISTKWKGLLVLENPLANYTSLWSRYGEYIGRTSLWLLFFIWLSVIVKLKTHGKY